MAVISKNKMAEKEIVTTVTPMMQQFFSIKEQHDDYILFYRMGDFYEMFFDDAVAAAAVLDISLTKRGKHENKDIPMCGVPVHSHEAYLQKLIRKGYKVAICEQVEDPKEAKKRGHKAVVRREVVRIITPGTLTEDALLDARSSSYIVALAKADKQLALAWADISTGEFFTSIVTMESLNAELARLEAKEILLSDGFLSDREFSDITDEWRDILTPHVPNFFDSTRAERRLKRFFNVASLDGFGSFSRAEIASCGSLLEYIDLTQKGTLPRFNPPKQFHSQEYMVIDAATRRNLELGVTLSGERKGSLLSVIDKTMSGAGGRLLRSYLSAPLANHKAINGRLDTVDFFVKESRLRAKIRGLLKHTPDINRALSRLCIGRGSPRDLAAVRDGLERAGQVAECFSDNKIANHEVDFIPGNILLNIGFLAGHEVLSDKLKTALKDEVGLKIQEGNFIQDGYSEELDKYRNIRKRSSEYKDDICKKYINDTGVSRLKIKENNMIGLYIEVPSQYMSDMPEHFVHRQTLANAVRYSTPELRELENEIINATDLALRLELDIFASLLQDVEHEADNICDAAQALASLDVATSLAELAEEADYCRPTVDDSLSFDIAEGRHIVVEANLHGMSEGSFISNSCNLEEKQQLWLLTGPNMAGKSTFLRQNALFAILAQIGSFVPAREAYIGVVDRVFSRVGAADDLARGRSTFMVEMIETAMILNLATERSFVILDEIGRGTSTYDGLSIAWAVVEHLHEKNRCRALFATHYHELTCLSAKLARIACYTMKVKEWEDKIIFMHEVVAGAADRSYGIHVAQLAGLPNSVINRAEEVLATIQTTESGSAAAKLAQDLPLFATAFEEEKPENNYQSKPSCELVDTIKSADIDSLSPREALDMLYSMKGMLEENN